jgi:hypothetical protein
MQNCIPKIFYKEISDYVKDGEKIKLVLPNISLLVFKTAHLLNERDPAKSGLNFIFFSRGIFKHVICFLSI